MIKTFQLCCKTCPYYFQKQTKNKTSIGEGKEKGSRINKELCV